VDTGSLVRLRPIHPASYLAAGERGCLSTVHKQIE